MEIINWLNANSGAVIGIAAVVLVSITGYYAYLTWRVLKANDTPEIAISLRPHEAYLSCVMLRIENIGTGAARNIQFRTEFSFKPDKEKALEELSFLKNGIDYLGPGQKIEHFLVNVVDKLDELKEARLDIGVTYADSMALKHKHERTFHLNFGEAEGYSRIGKPPLFEIAEATRSMKKDLGSLAGSFYRFVMFREPLGEHPLRKLTSSLESQIRQLPKEIQHEILEEVEFVVTKRVKEAREEE